MQKKDQFNNENSPQENDQINKVKTTELNEVSNPLFEQNTQSDEKDSGIDLYREEHGDLTNDNT